MGAKTNSQWGDFRTKKKKLFQAIERTLRMCSIIVSVRSVLWAVMTIAATLMILVSLFSDRWMIGKWTVPQSFGEARSMFHDVSKKIDQLSRGDQIDKDRSLGLFINCKKPSGEQMGFFFGECIPNLDLLEDQFYSEDDKDFPHAWKGGIICFAVGLAIMVLTVAISLLTPCLCHCICCSIFTLCGVFQSFSAVLFTLGLLAYPAGWGSDKVTEHCHNSQPFSPGECHLGAAFWLAVVGTVCTYLASSLSIPAHRATQGSKARYRRSDGEMLICIA